MPLEISTRLFGGPEDMIQEADQLLVDDREASRNRAIISGFYNGQETRSLAGAEDDNTAGIVNHLHGFDSIFQASQQIFGIYTAGPDIFEIEVTQGPELLRQSWQHRMMKCFNRSIKRSRSFKEEWRAAAGEMTLHGRAVLCYRNRWDLFPKTCHLYVPRGTGVMAEDIPYGIMPQNLSLSDLRAYRNRAEKDARWNAEALKGAISVIEGQVGRGASTGSSSTSAIGSNRESPEEIEVRRQEGGGQSSWRTHLPVYFVYEVDHDNPTLPVHLTILARYDATPGKPASTQQAQMLDKSLFHEKRHFQNVRHWVHPFFVDCTIGKSTTWHRTMGLGRLNYEPDVEVEEFFNEAMVGAKENVRRLYQVQNGADRETLMRWMSEGTNVLPEGVTVAEASKNPNYQWAFQIIDRLQLLSHKNAGGQFTNQNSGNEELEIQALERQNRNAKALGNRMNDIYECLDSLGNEIFRRMCYTVLRSSDRDYEFVQDFREEMDRLNIPYRDLGRINRGSYRFLKIRASRASGDGNTVQDRLQTRAMMSVLHLYDPEAQRKILRRFSTQHTGDYETAEELVPIQQKPDGSQINRANNENDTCRLRGITGYVPPINSDDLNLVHLPEHAGGMEALLALGQLRGWQQEDMAAFMSMGSHAMAHVQQVQAVPEQKQIGNEWAQKIESLARAGQEFANNMQEQQAQQQLSPLEQEKIDDMRHKRAMAERQQQALEMHRDRETSLKESKTASAEVTEFERLNQGDEQLANQRTQMLLNAEDRAKNRAASREKS